MRPESRGKSADHVTLERCLRKIVAERFDAQPFTFERRASSYRSSYRLEDVDLRLANGIVVELVFKAVGPRGLLRAAVHAKPSFLRDASREIECYAEILAGGEWGTARFYGSWIDAAARRYWLFLERVRGVRLNEEGDFRCWESAARWLATFHAAFADSVDHLPTQRRFLRYDAEMYAVWMRRAQTFAARSGTVHAVRALTRLSRQHDEAIRLLLQIPATFIHGEFYPSNVVVRADTGAPCVLDWEMAAAGPGLVDLAALTTGKWTPAERRTLISAYVEMCRRLGHNAAGSLDLTTALNSCRLHLAVRWLGWSAVWSPPRDQRFDWLTEAEEAAAGLA